MSWGLLWTLLLACGGDASSPEPVAVETESAPTTAPAPAAPTDVDVSGLKAALDAGAPVVDVRTLAEFDSGHVPDALHIPLNELERRVAELQPYQDAPLYVICQSGGRSAMASNWLNQRGFTAVNVVGGTAAWKAAGHATQP